MEYSLESIKSDPKNAKIYIITHLLLSYRPSAVLLWLPSRSLYALNGTNFLSDKTAISIGHFKHQKM